MAKEKEIVIRQDEKDTLNDIIEAAKAGRLSLAKGIERTTGALITAIQLQNGGGETWIYARLRVLENALRRLGGSSLDSAGARVLDISRDPGDARYVLIDGSRVRLGDGTYWARLFWALVKDYGNGDLRIGNKLSVYDATKAIDGFATDDSSDVDKDELRRAKYRLHKAASVLRKLLADTNLSLLWERDLYSLIRK